MKTLAPALLLALALMAACASWPPQSTALDGAAQTQAPPPLLPQDQLAAAPDSQAQAAGAALAARAAELRRVAAGL